MSLSNCTWILPLPVLNVVALWRPCIVSIQLNILLSLVSLYVRCLQDIDLSIKKQVEAAVKIAREDSEPPLEDLAKHIYSGGMNGLPVRGCDIMTELPSN